MSNNEHHTDPQAEVDRKRTEAQLVSLQTLWLKNKWSRKTTQMLLNNGPVFQDQMEQLKFYFEERDKLKQQLFMSNKLYVAPPIFWRSLNDMNFRKLKKVLVEMNTYTDFPIDILIPYADLKRHLNEELRRRIIGGASEIDLENYGNPQGRDTLEIIEGILWLMEYRNLRRYFRFPYRRIMLVFEMFDNFHDQKYTRYPALCNAVSPITGKNRMSLEYVQLTPTERDMVTLPVKTMSGECPGTWVE